MSAPTCPACNAIARLASGAEIYSHRADLAAKPVWKCDDCGAYVGCHPDTTEPLGTPAGPELRLARMKLHEEMIDPLWKDAWRDPAYAGHRLAADASKREIDKEYRRKQLAISRCARMRVYAFLAAQLGLTRDQCHTGLFDLATCRRAWLALRGVSYAEIRAWAHERRREAA